MAFDGSGNYHFPPAFPFLPDTPIAAEEVNEVFADIADALGTFISRNGGNGPQVAINWRGQKLTNLGTGSSDGDAVNYGQVFKNPVFNAPRAQASPESGDSSLRLATTEWVTQLGLSGSLPGQTPAKAGFFLMTTGTVADFYSIDSRGIKYIDRGNSGVSAVEFSYKAAEAHSLTITGQVTISFKDFPTDREAVMKLTLTNAGAFPPVIAGIVWIKPDGSETANFAETGVTWQTTGRDRVIICSEPGQTPWGKVVR